MFSEKTQLLNDLNFLISGSKSREETIKTLRLEMEDKHEIIRSSLAVCEGFEKMKGLEEELIKVKVKVAEEQANIVKILNQETLTSTRDPAEQGGSQREVHSGHSQQVEVVHKEVEQASKWTLNSVVKSVKSFFK